MTTALLRHAYNERNHLQLLRATSEKPASKKHISEAQRRALASRQTRVSVTLPKLLFLEGAGR
jgi:hypothetical protein